MHAFFELAAYDAVRAGLPLVRDLLGAEDPAIRTAAAHALAWFPEEAPALLPSLTSLAGDPDPVVAATALVALGLLAEPGTEGVVPLLEAALGDPGELVRWGAATALARLNGPAAGHRVAEELRCRLVRPAERGDEIPFFDGDVRGYAALSLCLFDDAYADGTFTALLAALPDVSGTEALPVAQAALRLAFPERPQPGEEAPFTSLDDRGRRLVHVLAQSPGTWLVDGRTFGNFGMLVRSYGLPGDPDAMAAYLAGTPSPRTAR